jgi:hypothetical protein
MAPNPQRGPVPETPTAPAPKLDHSVQPPKKRIERFEQRRPEVQPTTRTADASGAHTLRTNRAAEPTAHPGATNAGSNSLTERPNGQTPKRREPRHRTQTAATDLPTSKKYHEAHQPAAPDADKRLRLGTTPMATRSPRQRRQAPKQPTPTPRQARTAPTAQTESQHEAEAGPRP